MRPIQKMIQTNQNPLLGLEQTPVLNNSHLLLHKVATYINTMIERSFLNSQNEIRA